MREEEGEGVGERERRSEEVFSCSKRPWERRDWKREREDER